MKAPHNSTSTLPCMSHSFLLCLDLSLVIAWEPCLSGVPEFGCQFYWVIEHGVVMLLPSFSYFVKSQALHCHQNWGQFWALNMQNLYKLWILCQNKIDLQTPSGCLGNWMLLRETLHIWCQGNPNSHSVCFGSSGEFWGQGSNASGTLPPETVSSYWYFQSSWQNRTVYQMGCDMNLSCPDLPHTCCVSWGKSSRVSSSEQQTPATWILWTYYWP